ncbi:MAG: hypothetical protein WC790_03845 [Candidatus Paceibacterota bacterium]|jgi:hypothetical protein
MAKNTKLYDVNQDQPWLKAEYISIPKTKHLVHSPKKGVSNKKSSSNSLSGLVISILSLILFVLVLFIITAVVGTIQSTDGFSRGLGVTAIIIFAVPAMFVLVIIAIIAIVRA